MSKPTIPNRADYKVFYPINTRWSDNDIYGHVNNVAYYSYFDTAANRYLIEEGGLDISNADVVGYVVNSGCQYHAPITYPEGQQLGAVRYCHFQGGGGPGRRPRALRPRICGPRGRSLGADTGKPAGCPGAPAGLTATKGTNHERDRHLY
jgi:hypothetical protein